MTKAWYRRAAAALEEEVARNDFDAEAQYQLANLHSHGRGVAKKNPKKARQLYHRAAEQGHAPAQLELGNCYLDGCYNINADADDDEEEEAEDFAFSALLWFGLAAWQEQHGARGGVFKVMSADLLQRWRHVMSGAQGGDYKCAMVVAFCYRHGIGTECNETLAAEWKERALTRSADPVIPSSWTPSPMPSPQQMSWNRQRLS